MNQQGTAWRDLIGSTPLVGLYNVFSDEPFAVYAKLEMCNLGGSMKDRPALLMLEEALRNGSLRPGDTVVESSSGNMGISLAQICKRLKLSFVCVVDSRTNRTNIAVMRAFGARVEIIESTAGTDSLLKARLNRVRELLNEIPHSFWPNQYANPNNARAHEQSMCEIDKALDHKVDFLFCAAGTCGTIRGCSDYVRRNGRTTKIIAVDAIGSVIFGDAAAKRLVPGHGASIRPALYKEGMADDVQKMSDKDCVEGCRLLLEQEALMVGGSSGAVIMAIKKYAPRIPSGSIVAAILADRGERYLDTIYDDEWVANYL